MWSRPCWPNSANPCSPARCCCPDEEEPLTQGWEIKERLDHVVDAVIDSGDCGAEPTTVIDFSSGVAEVVRRGMGDPSRFE